MTRRFNQTGIIGVYLTIATSLVIIVGYIFLGRLASQQISASSDVLFAERAFHAANSGLEAALFELSEERVVKLTGEIEYDGEVASYQAQGEILEDQSVAVCACGRFRDQATRLFSGLDASQCQVSASCR